MSYVSKISITSPPLSYAALPGATAGTSTLTSNLLQKNHETHHLYFNHQGFHNHIPHHLLALYALGANESLIQRAYDENATYQRDIHDVNPKEPAKLGEDVSSWKEYLGKEDYYTDFLNFYKGKIEKDGWEKVVGEWVFGAKGLEREMLDRLFAGKDFWSLIHR